MGTVDTDNSTSLYAYTVPYIICEEPENCPLASSRRGPEGRGARESSGAMDFYSARSMLSFFREIA